MISIHALLAESDPPVPYSITDTRKFLSTLSLRRATLKSPIKSHRQKHFYPRSPCGERLAGPSGPAFLFNFYPRSPCGERRPQPPKARVLKNFYPRSPCGERQLIAYQSGLLLDFYPRSPCGERRRITSNGTKKLNFYPRSPCGERPCTAETDITLTGFLSTLSLRRATSMGRHEKPFRSNFYPRSPCGERRS